MKIKLFGLHIVIGSSAAAVAATLGKHLLEDAIIAAKKTELGRTVVTIVSDLETSSLSGSERMTKAIADAAPYVVGFVAKGGYVAAAADVEQFARSLIESALADVRATVTAQVAQAVLDVAHAGG